MVDIGMNQSLISSKTLEDDDKLMYIYDLCLGEFHPDFISRRRNGTEILWKKRELSRSMGELVK